MRTEEAKIPQNTRACLANGPLRGRYVLENGEDPQTVLLIS